MRPKSFFLAAGAAALCILGAAWLWLSRPAAPPASSASSASSGPASSAPGADSEALAQAVSSGNILQSSFKFPFPIPFRSETSAFSCIFAAFCRFNAERFGLSGQNALSFPGFFVPFPNRQLWRTRGPWAILYQQKTPASFGEAGACYCFFSAYRVGNQAI